MPVRRRGWDPQIDQPKPTRLDKPDHLTGFASKHWDIVEPQLSDMGLLKPIDLEALTSLCLWWHEYRTLQAAEAASSGDAYKRSIALASCFKNWSNMAARFGLTPKDREKLTLAPVETDDPLAEFIQ